MRIEDVEVGKTYRIRQWEDMEKEFGLTAMGNIDCPPYCFVVEMNHLCGKRCLVKDKKEGRIYIDIEGCPKSSEWNYTANMIEPIEENKMPIEIKPGYIVVVQRKVNREEEATVALPNKKGEIYLASSYGFHDLKTDFGNESFENEIYKITKVYGNPERGSGFDCYWDLREVLYDSEKRKMTKSEIEKELGYKIKIVEE